MGGNISWYVQGRGGCKGTCRILLSFSLFSCSFNKKKNCKAWQCYTLYVMPAAFPHTSSFPRGWAIKQQSPIQLLLLMAVEKQLPHAGLLQLGHRSYNIWDCVTSLQGFCGTFILFFLFSFKWNGEQRLERLICKLCTETSWRGTENVLCQKQAEKHNSCKEDHVYSLIFLVQRSKN